jgi:pyridoxal phosphate enzyme (YggS family)
MAVNAEAYKKVKLQLAEKNATLVAVSKTKPVEDIISLYHLGQRDFGENYVQEMIEKYKLLPKDIRWHFIGHLQSNKVKQLASFVHLIHSVDSIKLLKEINRQAANNNRIIDCLLQVHIAEEETKFGFDIAALPQVLNEISAAKLSAARVCGLMGMASFTNNAEKIKQEFHSIKMLFEQLALNQKTFNILSTGMSADFTIALEEGSTMVRIGSLLFGERQKNLG